MSRLERNIEDAVVKEARRLGVLVTKLNLQGHRGMPDRCFWLDGGRPLLIEFKRAGKRPTELQQYHIDKLRKLGYDVKACDNKADGLAIIREAVAPKARPAARR